MKNEEEAADCFQWFPVPGKGAIYTNGNTAGATWTSRNTYFFTMRVEEVQKLSVHGLG